METSVEIESASSKVQDCRKRVENARSFLELYNSTIELNDAKAILDDLVEVSKGGKMKAKCSCCGCHPSQHWNSGYSHKCHVCGTVFTTKESRS